MGAKHPAKFSEPIRFEDVAVEYPDLRFCLAHMGWPWWQETIMMLMKYPNVYADTSMVYMDSPKNYYEHLFSVNMNLNWLQNCFQDKVMFGSNTPRFRHVRSLAGIKNPSASGRRYGCDFRWKCSAFLRNGGLIWLSL